MKSGFFIAIGMAMLAINASAYAQDDIDVAPGIKLSPNGVLTLGELSAEIYHFDSSWALNEQHEAFTPADNPATQPTTAPSSHVITGSFAQSAGAFNLTERVAAANGGVDYSAVLKSDKDVPTNELSLVVGLPTDSMGGKKIKIDHQPFTLPAEPAKAGASDLLDQDGVKEIEIPTPTGTLTLSGNVSIHLQDDREWSDSRYDLRIHFDPNSDANLRDSKLQLHIAWKPAAG